MARITMEPNRLSRRQGDGAGDEIDDMYDGEEYSTKDKRAETHTTYYERDIDKHVADERQRQHLRRALEFQEGQYVTSDKFKDRATQNHEEDRRRIVATLASQLGLADSQKARVQHLMSDVLSVNSFGFYSTEQVALAVINVVAREDGRWIEDEEQFRDYMRYVELTTPEDTPDMAAMKRLRGHVRDRMPDRET